MTNASLFTSGGMNLLLQRLFQSSETIVSQFQMGTGTTTPQESDTALTTAVGTKYNFTAGYPIFDATNNRATSRGLVPAGDLNGNTLSETGMFNTDGTPVLTTHDVFTGIAKTSTKQIIVTWNIKIENTS